MSTATKSRTPRAQRRVRPASHPQPTPGQARAARTGTGMGWRRLRAIKGAAFGLPFFLGFLATFVIPVVYAIQESLYQQKGSGLGLGPRTIQFVGLANFAQGLTDGVFWAAVWRVFGFALVEIPVMLVVALGMALLLDALRRRPAGRFRVGLLVPYMVPGIVGSLIWGYLYSPSIGPLTPALKAIGIDVNFFSPHMVWFSIGNLLIWTSACFNMLILYGALRSVPRDVFDAARVDGASEWRIARSIKIPHVRGAIVLTAVLSIIGMLQIFNEPLLFRSFSPQTVTKDFTPILMIYNLAFTDSNYNYAAALSVILAVIVGALSVVFYRITNRTQS